MKYTPIKIIDGTAEQIKSQSCKSANVVLNEYDQSVTIATKHELITVHYDGTTSRIKG